MVGASASDRPGRTETSISPYPCLTNAVTVTADPDGATAPRAKIQRGTQGGYKRKPVDCSRHFPGRGLYRGHHCSATGAASDWRIRLQHPGPAGKPAAALRGVPAGGGQSLQHNLEP